MKRGFKTTPKALAWGHDFYAVQVGSLDRKLVGFRVTPKQARRIDLMARASVMTKQDYLYKRALEEEVVVRPDVRVYKMLRDEMARVYRELRRIRSAGEVDEGLAWTIDFLAREFSAMRGEAEPSDVEREDALIFGMSRR